jgi:hypothetical protein
MRRLIPWVVWCTLTGVACDGQLTTVTMPSQPAPPVALPFGAAPGPVTGPAPPTPTPEYLGLWRISDVYVPLSVGQVINSRITEDDPRCMYHPNQHCHYYRIAAPSDGLLEVTVKSESMGATYIQAPLDLYITNVTDDRGKGWDPVFGPGPQMRVSARAKAGAEYQISLYSWAPDLPGVEFELRAAMWSH